VLCIHAAGRRCPRNVRRSCR